VISKGLLITFEGGEATGKSFQARRLLNHLKIRGHETRLLAEPGGTQLGLRIRRHVKFTQANITPEAELFLFLASRAQLFKEVIKPALIRNEIVICDRYSDSTLAYQGYGRQLDTANIKKFNDFAVEKHSPHLKILLDMAVTEARKRRSMHSTDRFEQESFESSTGVQFHKRVREGYLNLAYDDPSRWLIIDATLPRSVISKMIIERVLPMITKFNPRSARMELNP